VERLRAQGHKVHGLFFNPNIHPLEEFIRRREAVEKLAGILDLPVIFQDEYPLEEFLRRVVFRETNRCLLCYQWRLETTARTAKTGRFDAFTTTLLFSRHQRHDWIKMVAEEEARSRGVVFHYEDFREGWKEGMERSRSMGLYRQNYCGCIYSERDRFRGLLRKKK
jgi:hypothetical protein